MSQNQKININIDPAVAKGTYCNLAMITHSRQEFVFDFAQNLPGMSSAQVVSRVIMTPEHAKRVLAALQDNIGKYERSFGEIDLEGGTYVVPQGGAEA